MKKEYITLTQNERMILQSYIPVVQGLGQYLEKAMKSYCTIWSLWNTLLCRL